MEEIISIEFSLCYWCQSRIHKFDQVESIYRETILVHCGRTNCDIFRLNSKREDKTGEAMHTITPDTMQYYQLYQFQRMVNFCGYGGDYLGQG